MLKLGRRQGSVTNASVRVGKFAVGSGEPITHNQTSLQKTLDTALWSNAEGHTVKKRPLVKRRTDNMMKSKRRSAMYHHSNLNYETHKHCVLFETRTRKNIRAPLKKEKRTTSHKKFFTITIRKTKYLEGW